MHSKWARLTQEAAQLLTLVCISIGIAAVIFLLQIETQDDSGTNAPHLPATQHHSVALGVPAITPHIQGNKILVRANTANPRIKISDVRAYLKTHQFPGGTPIAGNKPRVALIELMTCKEASQRLKGEYIGLSNNSLVYYVEWHGHFAVNGSPPAGYTPKPVDKGVELFDAMTGNLLLWWVPNA